ncbi:MAG: hypothetical protein H0W30_18760 [Gemmatimonadaceae bacterium]|nr:hypothetical protein [Gemmatimonadaceae bacterium]MDQ3517162.1 hypothetical protein [Gemmatimonadota bacterium]
MTTSSDQFRRLRALTFISLLLAPAAARSGAAQEPGTPPVAAPDSMLADSAGMKAKRAATARPKSPVPVWPVPGPTPLPGSILPAKRIVAYYGNPLSKRMGILGQVPPDEMLSRLDKEVAAWNAADPSTPVQPALHLIAVVAQAGPGRDGMYRARMSDSLIERVASWAARRNAIVFLDVQVGKSNVKAELPRLVPFLKRPNVHLGLDPEFSMKGGHKPGTRIGTLDASDINYTIGLLSQLVTEHNLPPKVLVIHRFTRPMLTRTKQIELDPRVQVVIEMDGFGPPRLKRDSYRAYVYAEPVQFTGFKIFYKNDKPRMTPEEVLKLTPAPVYIQYQ